MKTKNIISFLLMLCFVAMAGHTVKAQNQKTITEKTQSNCDKSKFSFIECGFFKEGYQDGEADAKSNRNSDFMRYKAKLTSQYYTIYSNGYNFGYADIKNANGNSDLTWSNIQKSAYDKGHNYGKVDRKRKRSRSPERYDGRYEKTNEVYYRFGYADGYENKRKKYDQPLAIVGTPLVAYYPNRTGTATGTATWSGRVVNRVNIVFKASEITNKAVRGATTRIFKDVKGELPSNAILSVKQLDGRGTVKIIQQPTRDNDGTAIIDVYDPRRGADNYKFEATWQASEETYTSGKLVWRGRVDATVDIKISGADAQAIDKTASGLNVLRSDLSGFLAGRSGTVRVEKKDGRGTVSVVEQPSRQNDYTAVIRIVDSDGGDDEYEIEVTW